MTNEQRIAALSQRIDLLNDQLGLAAQDLRQAKMELNKLKSEMAEQSDEKPFAQPTISAAPSLQQPRAIKPSIPAPQFKKASSNDLLNKWKASKPDLEKFIGENLASKIGIIITVIGVAIGVKYAIDHELISPLARIILGYLAAGILLFFAIRFKPKYENFSAVLLSGSMASFYFITFAAWNYYSLIPQALAFALMALFAAFTAFAAVKYNREWIAFFGLVGAYAVPFLLNDGSDKAFVFLSYITIINLGILFVSFKKDWKPTYYISFALTWIIFLFWYQGKVIDGNYNKTALVFATIFFLQFYIVFLAYKTLRFLTFNVWATAVLIINAFVYFGLGYYIISNMGVSDELIGLFAVANAALHLLAASILHKRKVADKHVEKLVQALAIVFLTIAIPVTLNGNWVTILWAAEAALLLYISRKENVDFYEYLSYGLAILSIISLNDDWDAIRLNNEAGQHILPFFNSNLLCSIIVVFFYGLMIWFRTKMQAATNLLKNYQGLNEVMGYIISGMFILGLYRSIGLEIDRYWGQQFEASVVNTVRNGISNQQYNYDTTLFRQVWQVNYSLLFVSVMSLINIYYLRHQILGKINLVLNAIALAAFLSFGLYNLSELRESYLDPQNIFHPTGIYIYLRYISMAFAALALVSSWRYIKAPFMKMQNTGWFELVVHGIIIWTASSELIHLLSMAGYQNVYKSGLSILWGSYALLLIILGIIKRKNILRFAGFGLFGVTLVKLIFYDIAMLSTIAKTIVFISLGALLLIISYLYNRYRVKLFGNNEEA